MAEQEMTLLEKAARAICDADGMHVMPQPWDVDHARAALLAAGFPPEALDQPAGAWVVVPKDPAGK